MKKLDGIALFQIHIYIYFFHFGKCIFQQSWRCKNHNKIPASPFLSYTNCLFLNANCNRQDVTDVTKFINISALKILFLSQVSECETPVKPAKPIIYTKIKKWNMRRYFFLFELYVVFFFLYELRKLFLRYSTIEKRSNSRAALKISYL